MESKLNGIEYVGIILSETNVKRGDSVNVMVMIKKSSLETTNCSVKLFIAASDCNNWQLCSVKDYCVSPEDHLHAYLNISGEFLSDTGADEFLVFAGDTPPKSDTQLRGVSDIIYINNR